MSIINSDGLNANWQLNVLRGLQGTVDELKLIEGNTDQVEATLLAILSSLQNGTDYEAMLVVDSVGVTWLEIRIWNGTTFNPPVYYLAGSNVPGIPAAPITYINPNTYLALITSYTLNLVAMASSLTTIQGDTSTLPLIQTNTNPNARTPRFIRDIGNVSVLPQCYSASFASVGTADAIINGSPLSPGQTINFDAGSLNNYLIAGSFTADTLSNLGAELLITYID
jgi:hypothetical protein